MVGCEWLIPNSGPGGKGDVETGRQGEDGRRQRAEGSRRRSGEGVLGSMGERETRGGEPWNWGATLRSCEGPAGAGYRYSPLHSALRKVR